jgi:antitoxin component of RelBE/YafQ-DinJ toxin-antitoxin module
MKKTELLQIRVSPELKNSLKKIASDKGMTMSGLIEDMLGVLAEDPNLFKDAKNLEAKVDEMGKRVSALSEMFNEVRVLANELKNGK